MRGGEAVLVRIVKRAEVIAVEPKECDAWGPRGLWMPVGAQAAGRTSKAGDPQHLSAEHYGRRACTLSQNVAWSRFQRIQRGRPNGACC